MPADADRSRCDARSQRRARLRDFLDTLGQRPSDLRPGLRIATYGPVMQQGGRQPPDNGGEAAWVNLQQAHSVPPIRGRSLRAEIPAMVATENEYRDVTCLLMCGSR